MRRVKTRPSNRRARDGFVFMLLIATLVGLAGCLGTVVLVITPETTVLGLGESITFTAATPTGTPVTGVTWTISSGSGTIERPLQLIDAPDPHGPQRLGLHYASAAHPAKQHSRHEHQKPMKSAMTHRDPSPPSSSRHLNEKAHSSEANARVGPRIPAFVISSASLG